MKELDYNKKSDVLILVYVFEKFAKLSVHEFGIDPLNCVSLPGFTWQCGSNYTGINLKTAQDKCLNLTLENNIPGGKSSVMGDRYVTSDENKIVKNLDATN